MVNFGPLAAGIFSLVWCTPVNFNGFRILAALLHGTPVLGVSQTLRRWTEGATHFGRAAITLGIGPHSSLFMLYVAPQNCEVIAYGSCKTSTTASGIVRTETLLRRVTAKRLVPLCSVSCSRTPMFKSFLCRYGPTVQIGELHTSAFPVFGARIFVIT